MRLFIAADLPDEARAALAVEQERIAAALGSMRSALRWAKPDHAHLTLVFIGNLDDARVPSLIERVSDDIAIAPFELEFGGVGVFPPRGAPRVLWIGIGGGARELGDLRRELAARVAALEIPLEERTFRPHFTLARWRESRSADRARALAIGGAGVITRAHVSGATLYQSCLSPAGPAYTALARANLTGRA